MGRSLNADHQAVGTESPSVLFRPAPEIRKEESRFREGIGDVREEARRQDQEEEKDSLDLAAPAVSRATRRDGHAPARAQAMTRKSTGEQMRFEIHGDLDRRGAEALRLELVWLARRYGVEIEDFQVRPVTVTRSRRSA
jgi:hypothetical protein